MNACPDSQNQMGNEGFYQAWASQFIENTKHEFALHSMQHGIRKTKSVQVYDQMTSCGEAHITKFTHTYKCHVNTSGFAI